MKTKIIFFISISMLAGLFACNQTESDSHKGHDHSTEKQEEVKTENVSHKDHNKSSESMANTQSFKVEGNCGICKTRIETAATSVEGVTSAVWNVETKLIDVSLEKGTDIHKVHMAIAKAGHDTEMHKADDAVYDALPGCCQYR